MSLTLNKKNGGKVLEVQVSGKLAHEDFQKLEPEFDSLVKKCGKIRVLFEMTDFHGWDCLASLWDEIKFDVKHFPHIERIAAVGDKAWEKAMMDFCVPFTSATVRCFDRAQLASARAWLDEA